MRDDPAPALDISRRTLLRRGAAVGALVWTAPVVQSLSRPAFAADGTPEPEPDGKGISYIAVVVTCALTSDTFRAKYEFDEGEWESDPGPPNPAPGDCYPPGYGDATPVHGGNQGMMVSPDPSDPSKASLTIPMKLANECVVVHVAASAFGGQSCEQLNEPCAGGCTLHFDL